MRLTKIALTLLAVSGLSWAVTEPGSAAPTVLGSGGPDEPPGIRVLSEHPDGLELEFTLPSLLVEQVNAAGQVFQSVAIPRGGTTDVVGQPMLPTFTRLISIPARVDVRVQSEVEEQDEDGGWRLIPVQSEEGREFSYEGAAYSRDDFGSEPLAKVDQPVLFRNLRVVRLTFQPVRYNPAQGILRVARKVRVRVSFAGENPVNVRPPDSRPIPTSFDRLYRELVLNYPGLTGGRDVQSGAWLIIAPNDNNVTSRLQPLINWRQRKGLPVVLATTGQTGTSATQIKNYIQNAYDTWPVPPEYVVLAGDADGSYAIPTWFESLSGYNGEGDHPYSLLAGGDQLSDVHVGRLSFSTLTELEVIVNKIIGYESTPYLQDPDWYRRGCVVGDPTQSGYSTVQVMQWIKTRLREIGYTQVDTIFSSPFVSQMSTALNRGDTVFCYRGYYQMSGWSNSNTYALTNGWKMPFAVISTCGTGDFVGGTARSEGFLRANSGATSPKGAIGAIGTASIGTHTRFNNCLTFGIWMGVLYEGIYDLGAALNRGKLEMYLNYGSSTQSNYVTIYSYWNSLMGDPAVECWTGYPDPIAVTHPSSIALGANSVTVNVTEGGGAPSAGARVCLWKGSEIYVVGQTDTQGVCELPITTSTGGDLFLTVTRHNRYPYLATVPVAAQTVYVGYQSHAVDDDDNGSSHGNGDGQVNPGETVEFKVQLKNFGIQPAGGVTAHLTTSDPYLTITDADESYGDIAAEGSAWCPGSYLFSVDPGCPDGHTLRFGLDVSSGSNQWNSLIELAAVSADLQNVGYVLYDAGPNGLLDPDEIVQLTVDLKNFGGMTAMAPTATLISMSEFLDAPDPNGTYPDIAPGGFGSNPSDKFTIHALATAYRGYEAHVKLTLEFSGGVRDTATVIIPVGTRGSTDPTGPDRYGYYAFDNTDTSYPEAPAYNWIEIDPAYGGDGVEIPLNDYGSYQDKTLTVDLPFPVAYYGASYTKASVCSNGWIEMGSTYLTDYRNWTIPSAGGPNGVIAAFWDDLYRVSGSKILQKYDAANHRWIVEWSRMRNDVGGSTETFEAIFYDPVYHPTDSGDGEIVFQYNQVVSLDSTDGYVTVGIEKPDNSDGVLYTYFNLYSPGAATLATGRAIRFLPIVETLTGQINGTVRNQAGNGPLSGATVAVLENGHEYQTGQNGTYQGAEAAGVYSLAASREGFAADTVSGVHVIQGSAVTVDFLLRDIQPPSVTFRTTPPSTSDSLGPYPIFATITDMSPIAQASVFYRTYDEPFLELSMTLQGLTGYRADIPGQKWTTQVQYYIYVRDEAGNVTTLPPGAPFQLYTFWVAPLRTAFVDDLESDHGWVVGAAGDNATSGIWERGDPNATYNGETMVQPEDDHTAPPGAQCYLTGNSPPGSGQDANDVDGGRTSLTTPVLDLTINGTVLLRYYRWYTNDTGSNPGEDFWQVQASGDGGQSWATLENTNVSDRSWRFLEFDLGSHIPLTNSVLIRFVAQDSGGPSIVEAGVDDLDIVFFGLTPAGVNGGGRLRFGLAEGLPNPIRPGEAVRFSLERAGEARLEVYDVQGRAVRRLAEGRMGSGVYSVSWDGRDDGGRALPTGVYFYRLQSGERVETKKTLLMR